MKKPSYREAIRSVVDIHGGDFDDGDALDAQGLIGVYLVAEIFDLDQEKVVTDCNKLRAKEAKAATR